MKFNEYNGFICQQFEEQTAEYNHPYEKDIATHYQVDLMSRIKDAEATLDEAERVKAENDRFNIFKAQIGFISVGVLLALAVPGFVYVYMKYGPKTHSMSTKP